MSQQTDIPVTTRTGLTSEQAAQLYREGKGNAPPKGAGRSTGQILFENIFTWFNILNFILALVLASVHSWRNMLFMGVVVFNTLISTVQEIRAKKTVDRLTLLVAAPVHVMRDGQWSQLPSEQLVLHDVVRFSMGDQVCADALVLEGQGAANESLLTGESDAVHKKADSPLYSGSFLTEGRLTARLVAVGADSYAGQLVQSVRKVKVARSQLMEDLQKLIRFISWFLIPIGLLLFAKQYWLLKDPVTKAVPGTVAAVLGMIPEGLMLLTSMALAVGVIRLGRQDTLVQELYGIENLARVDTVCVDKTGTITKGCLTVQQVVPLSGTTPQAVDGLAERLLAASQDDNLTMQALRRHWPAQKAAETNARWVPFSSEHKWGAVCFDNGCLVLGAPDYVMRGRMPAQLAQQVEGYAAQGLRVLLLATAFSEPREGVLPEDVSPAALLLLGDEIREDFGETARYLMEQGVAIKVISGDNPLTVAEVARRAGLAGTEEWVDASTLDTEEKLKEAAGRCTVFGRVAPEQKKQLIQALKDRGRTVAMVGDGVNDVPALKVCDCAIAMAGGSDAAQKVSQVILLKDNFSALPAIILEGRRVINNITRSASLFLVKTCYSFALALILLFSPFSYPFEPIQLTLISTFTVGTPAFVLALTPNKERVRGDFLLTILRNALPGALNNVLLVVALMLLSGPLGIPQEQLSTIAVGIVGITGLLVLAMTCLPFNRDCLLLLAAMAAGLIGSAVLFGSFFKLVPLTGAAPWALAVFLLAAPFTLWLMYRGADRWLGRILDRRGAAA